MSEAENVFHAPSPEELAPLFPKYQILSLVAMGGMGAVYHAIQTSLEREVAIKILPVEFGKDPEFCEGFVAEARAMARLNHPNLISVYDFGEVNEMLFTMIVRRSIETTEPSRKDRLTWRPPGASAAMLRAT